MAKKKAKAFEGKETPEEEAKEHDVMEDVARKAMKRGGRKMKRHHKRGGRKMSR